MKPGGLVSSTGCPPGETTSSQSPLISVTAVSPFAHRKGAVGAAVGAAQLVFAVTGDAELAQRVMLGRADHKHPAVLDVGGQKFPGGGHQGVVGVVNVSRFRAGNARVAVAVDDPPLRDVDHADHEVVLLGDDDLAPVGGEEGVVGQVEGLACGAGRRGPGSATGHALGAHLDQAVVVAVGDQYGSRQHAGVRARGEGGACARARVRATAVRVRPGLAGVNGHPAAVVADCERRDRHQGEQPRHCHEPAPDGAPARGSAPGWHVPASSGRALKAS